MAVDEAAVSQLQARLRERELKLREDWIRSMEARLVADELSKCHRTEGVNHYENCRWLSEKYLTMMRDSRVKGYKHIDI